MALCNFCKIKPKEQLKSCVCKKVSYCSKDCQAKDWKVHKPSCPPFIVRESPGKGRGLFATRKIMEGQLILEEYPFLTLYGEMNLTEFQTIFYPQIDEETKAKILQLYDPADNFKKLDNETVEKLVSKDPLMMFYKEAETDEVSKIFRIITGNFTKICGDKDLYSDTTEMGLDNTFSLINHSCVPTATSSWVMGDFKRRQLRAMMVIEKDLEITISYFNAEEFGYGSRESRRQKLLEICGFPCECSECSLEGEDLEENDAMRAEIREKMAEIKKLLSPERSDPVPIPRKSVQKVMNFHERRVKLIRELNLRAGFVPEMIDSYNLAVVVARRLDVTTVNDPDIYKQEALKYARMFGDNYIYLCNKYLGNPRR